MLDLGEIESIEPFQKLVVPEPPKELFVRGTGIATHGVVDGGSLTYKMERIEYPVDGGIEVYMEGSPYPKKGFPFPEAVLAVNLAKKILIEGLKTLSKFWLASVHLLKARNLDRVIDAYNKVVMINLESFIMKPKFRTKISLELGRIAYRFLYNWGVKDNTAMQFAEVVSAIVEYDDAYRYRLEDIFSETTKEALLKSPRKEILRLANIAYARDGHDTGTNNVRNKLGPIVKIISLLFLIPKVKKTFRLALEKTNFDYLQYDDADRYWVSMRSDYDFMGKTYSQRQKDLKDRGLTIPWAYKVTVPRNTPVCNTHDA